MKKETTKTKKNDPKLNVRSTKPFRLHDVDQPYVPIPLKRLFGFIPDTLVIEKIPGVSNKFRVMAVMTKEALKAQREAEKLLAEQFKKDKMTVERLQKMDKKLGQKLKINSKKR